MSFSRRDTPPSASSRTIVVVSASIGAGHDGVAYELARRLEEHGFRVTVLDFLDLLPRPLGRAIRNGYRAGLARAPWTYRWLYSVLDSSRVLSTLPIHIARLAQRRFLRAIPDDVSAVVSTYPLASQLCGYLRRRGALTVPVATFLTDFSVHRLWVAGGVDMHLALHSISAAQARHLGACRVVIGGPAVQPRFSAPPALAAVARQSFGLPPEARLALLVAGAWGAGDLERSASDIARTGLVLPVVACGRNEVLRGA